MGVYLNPPYVYSKFNHGCLQIYNYLKPHSHLNAFHLLGKQMLMDPDHSQNQAGVHSIMQYTIARGSNQA